MAGLLAHGLTLRPPSRRCGQWHLGVIHRLQLRGQPWLRHELRCFPCSLFIQSHHTSWNHRRPPYPQAKRNDRAALSLPHRRFTLLCGPGGRGVCCSAHPAGAGERSGTDISPRPPQTAEGRLTGKDTNGLISLSTNMLCISLMPGNCRTTVIAKSANESRSRATTCKRKSASPPML